MKTQQMKHTEKKYFKNMKKRSVKHGITSQTMQLDHPKEKRWRTGKAFEDKMTKNCSQLRKTKNLQIQKAQ